MALGPPAPEDPLIVEAQLVGLGPSAKEECQTPSPHANRVAERIYEIVVSLVTSRLRDPRLELATATDIRTTGDPRYIMIFYTAYDDQRKFRDAG